MTKKTLWLISSLTLVFVVMVSSIFTIVYSANVMGGENEYFSFNFLTTKQTTGNVITTSLDNTSVNNSTTMQSMKIANKFTFTPTNSASTESLTFGASAKDVISVTDATQNFVLIPIRVLNNMIDFGKVFLKFKNVDGHTALKGETYYSVYNYQTKTLTDPKNITENFVLDGQVVRGEFVDLCVAVFASANNFYQLRGQSVYFTFAVDMVQA